MSLYKIKKKKYTIVTFCQKHVWALKSTHFFIIFLKVNKYYSITFFKFIFGPAEVAFSVKSSIQDIDAKKITLKLA